jgi:ankyrin repeat protein
VAAQLGQLEICRTLLDQNADINLKNGSGVAPLFLAARQGHVDVVSLLLASGADPNTQVRTRYHSTCCTSILNSHDLPGWTGGHTTS